MPPNEPRRLRRQGHVLVLTQDPALLTAQFERPGELDPAELLREPLLDKISTDEIIPGWCCYWYDEKLGDFAYLGLRGGVVGEGTVRHLRPQIVVSGEAKGCGSSREHAVYAERYAGVSIVFARSFEKIYEQNCRNLGIVTCDDFAVLDALLAGEELPLDDFVGRFDELERSIVRAGGLFGLSRSRATTQQPLGDVIRFGPDRPLNEVERIIQRHLSPANPCPAGAAVQVGQSYLVQADVRFSHEYVTPMAGTIFRRELGAEAVLDDPDTCWFFQDHLSLAPSVVAGRPNGGQLVARIGDLNDGQRAFAETMGGHFVGPRPGGGSEAICHNHIVEHVARPGDVIIGTDSHTCTAGAVGALAFGVGATDMANAWYGREVVLKVPEVVRVRLDGSLGPGVCAKDVVLRLLAEPIVQDGGTRGRVLLFTGDGVAGLNLDERATLCNMAVEARATTALFVADEITAEHLRLRSGSRGGAPVLDPRAGDAGSFAAEVVLHLDAIEPMVALPGDPTHAVPLSSLPGAVPVDKVYGGSCTGGKAHDMDLYAEVLGRARDRGWTVAPGIAAYIQTGSAEVLAYAEAKGYVSLFVGMGVTVLPPSCGACINAGPGVSDDAGQVTVSAQNRNFPGRSGPGQVYLASPYVVAASAVAGRLCSVEELFGEPSGGAAP